MEPEDTVGGHESMLLDISKANEVSTLATQSFYN
jgi:hypothetical protein